MALKSKKILSALFRVAMRKSAKTAEVKVGDSQITETGISNVSLLH